MRVAAIAGSGALAITLELLPERIDLLGFLLQLSGLGSLLALALSVALGGDDGQYAKYGTLVGAYIGLAVFLGLVVVQGIS